MNAMTEMSNYRHEKVLFVNNEKAGLKAIIAVHNTNLGPAIGGCRLFPYASYDDALFDVLRLSRGMTHKNAVAGLPHGGGKGVIIADPSQKTEAMFEAFAEAVNNLGGQYITAEDVNTTCDDALVMLRKTKYLCGLPQNSGDPSPFTARGVWQGIRATAKVAMGADSLEGLTIAVQGLGKVGYDLCRLLHESGAKLIVANRSNKAMAEKAAEEFGAKIVATEEIYAQECDIFSPNAMGAIINPTTIAQLNCKAVAGGANNQILDDASGIALKQKGIFYAPDFVINGGGVINAAAEVDGPYNKEEVLVKVDNIYNSIEHILTESKKTGEPEGVIATRYAESLVYGK
ncbi:MAG: Glu/Leu/Phe/Val dehydrogenase [Oscillospiraceae bacterium]|nr:Glu/Leu/Phe/Val dehydrogenase [Oscillospiraceae bacterium]